MDLSLENIQENKINFDSIPRVANVNVIQHDVLQQDEEIDNHFIHVLLEKGVNIPGGDPVKEVIFDQVWCFDTDEEQQSFLDYILAYNQ
jgi:hypothetical protein